MLLKIGVIDVNAKRKLVAKRIRKVKFFLRIKSTPSISSLEEVLHSNMTIKIAIGIFLLVYHGNILKAII
ncbi:hypothetical protein WOSG25_071120 [Weissella oryzae SG25]|uniref:Uncharacterized protein n=1 Tax=Weissella oryzae (strain DSM 25784 / JCM 18191 / LMG 30913 / SG25) TaxID=1329250 RepID=A0A069CTI5_WEIOS|nr:hypothetical protein WOSG25_071120 [Weissella oryzae SG25]